MRIWDIDRDSLLRIPLSYVPRATEAIPKSEFGIGGAALTKEEILLRYRVLSSRIAAFFSHNDKLHNARFAKAHELTSLLSPTVDGTHLLLGESHFSHVLRVQPTTERRELGHMLACGPTGSGKTLLITSQLYTWPFSAVVNDVKGEIWNLTGRYRATLGPVYVVDPIAGVGNQYDPLHGRDTEDKLLSSAKHLLFEPHEGDGIVFRQRAEKMLTQLFRAARLENQALGKETYRLLPYVRHMVNGGLKQAAERLQAISPELATKFLAGAFAQTDFKEDKFLLSAWGTLDTRLYSLLTDNVVRCCAGSDFTPSALMTSEQPITVYLRWPEPELLALAPLIRLVWESLIYELITTYDTATGNNCKPVLLLIDEAGRTASIPNLPDHLTTVRSRGISLVVAIQSLSQLIAIWGKARQEDILNNCESHVYYRPSSHETAEDLQKWLGDTSGFAHSETDHEGAISKGSSEQRVALMTAQEIKQLEDDEIIGWHRNLPPFRAKRMNWRRFPLLRQRQAIPPPPLSALPALEENLPEPASRKPVPLASWHMDPNLFRKWRPLHAPNGIEKRV